MTQAPMSPALIALLLSMMLGIQPITTDLYLPALPALTESFAAPMTHAQLTLSALLLAFGISQLVWGPLSDRFGRRPILLWGLSAYTLASIASTFTPTMSQLISWRVVQGAAMGAVVMCARAIVRDLYKPTDGARVMSRALTGLGIIAGICAPLGGVLAGVLGWRTALASMAVFSAASLLLIALRFQESLTLKNPHALNPATMARTWLMILRNPVFLTWSALSIASYGAMFTFLAGSSFVFIKVLGLSTTQYGLLLFVASMFYILGTMLCRRLLVRFGIRQAIAIAGVMSITAGTSMGLLAWAGVSNVWAVVIPHFLFMIGHGIHQPCSQSGVAGPFPQAAGAASAMNGFMMMAMAFVMGGWMGRHMDGTVLPMTNGMWFWTVLLAGMAWTVVQKYGEPAHETAKP
ncbi:MAG: multidrug effflux MFS transporter [Pseudomonadota bacterium]